MIKQLSFDELIIEMRDCFNININEGIDEQQDLLFVHEEGLGRKYTDDNKVIFTVNKKKILDIHQFHVVYDQYCKEARYELKLILVTVKPKVIFGIEVSERRGNPHGLVNVAFAMALPKKECDIVINEVNE